MQRVRVQRERSGICRAWRGEEGGRGRAGRGWQNVVGKGRVEGIEVGGGGGKRCGDARGQRMGAVRGPRLCDGQAGGRGGHLEGGQWATDPANPFSGSAAQRSSGSGDVDVDSRGTHRPAARKARPRTPRAVTSPPRPSPPPPAPDHPARLASIPAPHPTRHMHPSPPL